MFSTDLPYSQTLRIACTRIAHPVPLTLPSNTGIPARLPQDYLPRGGMGDPLPKHE